MKIAIVKLSALGDIIHAMVALQFIKKKYPDCQIDWVVEEGFKGILTNNPDINTIHTVNIKKAKKNKSLKLLLTELKKLRKLPKYDVVIDTQGLIKSAVVSRFIPSHKRFGFDRLSAREYLSSFFYTNKVFIDYSENVIIRNAKLISYALNLNISNDDLINKKPLLYPSNTFNNTILHVRKNNIIIIIGASFDCKKYPLEKYREIVMSMNDNFIVTWGNEAEKNQALSLADVSDNVIVSNKLSLGDLIGLIKKSDLVIGGDTGPTHMAWALNIPSITLYGATPGYRTTLVTDKNLIIESDSEVNPYRTNKNDYSIKSIEAIEVVKIAKVLLKGEV